MKNVVVTGATGMLGSHLIDNLLLKGLEVTAVVRKNSLKISNISPTKVKIVECDSDDILTLAKLVNAKFDVFYHFAWEGVYGDQRNDPYIQEKNIKNTLNAITVAKKLGCSKFVFAGSQAEYGISDVALTCDTVANPVTAYGIAKNTAFCLGKVLADGLGIKICNGRILSAYGKRDNNYTMVMSTLTNLLSGKDCNLTLCEQTWDFINAEDVAEAFYLIGEKGHNGKAYPIGSGQATKLKEYVEIMYQIAQNKTAKLNFGAVSLSANAVKYLVADIKELTEDTGFMPKISFEQGIIKLIEWLKLN